MSELLELHTACGNWAVLVIVVLSRNIWYFRDVYTNAKTRAATISWLREDGLAERYRRLLTRTLDWVDARLSRDEADLPRSSPRVAWSAGLLSFNLALALGYPVLSLLVVWVWTGSGAVGGRVLIAPEAGPVARATVIFAICVMFSGMIHGKMQIRSRWRRHVQVASISLGVSVAGFSAGTAVYALAFAVITAFGGTIGGAYAISFIVGVAFSFSSAGILSATDNGPYGVTEIYVGAIAILFALASASVVVFFGRSEEHTSELQSPC